MCVQFTCMSCKLTFTDHCPGNPTEAYRLEEYKEEPDDPVEARAAEIAASLPCQLPVCPGLSFNSKLMKCDNCIRVKGAISKLHYLIFMAPFLTTEGMSALDQMSAWQKKHYLSFLKCEGKSFEDKAESRAERQDYHRRVKQMGLVGVVDAREEHQGFETLVTPEDITQWVEGVNGALFKGDCSKTELITTRNSKKVEAVVGVDAAEAAEESTKD